MVTTLKGRLALRVDGTSPIWSSKGIPALKAIKAADETDLEPLLLFAGL